MTLSAGVGTFLPREGEDQARLLERADRTLYEARNAGWNRVMVDAS